MKRFLQIVPVYAVLAVIELFLYLRSDVVNRYLLCVIPVDIRAKIPGIRIKTA